MHLPAIQAPSRRRTQARSGRARGSRPGPGDRALPRLQLPRLQLPRLLLPLLLLALLLGGCRRSASSSASGASARSFYLWRGELTLDARDRSTLEALKVKRLYLRVFDVTWSARRKRPDQTPSLRITGTPEDWVELVPVVFITPDVFRDLGPGRLPWLAGHLLDQIAAVLGPTRFRRTRELQIDCDWYPTIRGPYFGFLRELSRQAAARAGRRLVLSATLRLHQLADRDAAGMPPTDRVTLMLYSLTPVRRFGTQNALLDPGVVEAYLRRAGPYPLPVDVALGLFSWAAHFNADRELLGLIREVRAADLDGLAGLQKEKGAVYRVTGETRLGPHKLLVGDRLRLDEQRLEDVLTVARMLRARLRQLGLRPPEHPILFHYDPEVIRRFTGGRPLELRAVYQALEE